VVHRAGFRDRRVARLLRRCQDLPGQRLFQYLDDAGERRPVESADVNAYLREALGADFSAKDFRTWAGTVLAATALAACEPVENVRYAKKNVSAAIASVASRLGNTPAICRKCYVHPVIVAAYLGGELTMRRKTNGDDLAAAESEVLRFLERRLKEAA